MRPSLFLVFILCLVISCDSGKSKEDSLLSYVPAESSVIIKINNLNTFRGEIRNNSFLKEAGNSENAIKINRLFQVLNHIQSDTTNVVAVVEEDSTHLLFVTYEMKDSFLGADSTSVPASSDSRILVSEADSSQYFSARRKGKIIISTSQDLINRVLASSNGAVQDEQLYSLFNSSSTEKSASFFINTMKSNSVFPRIFRNIPERNDFFTSKWLSFDLNSGQQYLYLNGIAKSKDTIGNFLHLFKDTKPVINVTPTIAGPRTDAIMSYTFDDYEKFATNQQTYLDSPYSINTALNTTEELGIIYENGQSAVVISAYASEGLQRFLDGLENSNVDYQGYQIIGLSKKDFLNETFQPLVSGFNANYYAIVDNKFVFAEQKSVLESIIGNHNSGASFKESVLFKSAEVNLTNESSILMVSNARGLQYVGPSLLSKEFVDELQVKNAKDYVFSSQLVADESFYHTHIAINNLRADSQAGTTSPLFSIQLDGEIANAPQFVVNHRTNKKEIVVQDTSNNLYLISTDGKVLWKKLLDGPIQGEIKQVDIYKNGRLQLAFTTSNQFLILDRNGKEVKPFNKTYPGGNLNPLAVFDYENNKNYRFVVTQGSKVMMYNSRGNIVSGFTYTDANSPIIREPKHIRIGQRDYLVFMLENGSLKILSRVGKERISVEESIQFSRNEVYLYRNKFILTDENGMLYSIDTKGNIGKSKLNFNEDHGIDATVKTLATLNENTLTIKGRARDLDLGVYMKPKIFYIYDKIYVSTTDIQSGQVYLFDSANKPISNFPVFGNSTIDLADIDNDGQLELVTKDQENSQLIYAIR